MTMRRKTKTEPAPLRGQKWRATHQATIDAILGAKVRRVISRGSKFYNKDNWVARTFGAALCEWAELNPASVPTESDVAGWVVRANRTQVWGHQKGIVIAQTPDELPKWLAFALVGGGYHEAWHTKYSRLKPLNLEEVWPKVADLFALIPYLPEEGKPGWKGLTGPLLTWSNIIEDIRIERVGCREFPGAPDKMKALQDLILKQEEEGLKAAEHRGLPVNTAMNTVIGAFRDLGLGYRSPRQKEALRRYEERNPKAWEFVNSGPLRPFLDRAIALGPDDDLESLWLAMEVVAAIAAVAQPPVDQREPQPEEDGSEDEDLDDSKDLDSDEGEGDAEDSEDGEEQEQDGSGSSGSEDSEDDSDEEDEGPQTREQSDEDAQSGGGGGGFGTGGDGDAIVWKKGDRAVLSRGPHKGQTVEVVRAGLPDEKGVQDLEFKVVEPWWKEKGYKSLQDAAQQMGIKFAEEWAGAGAMNMISKGF